MQTVALKEAESRLPELIGLVAKGEDILITNDDGAGFKIIQFKEKEQKPTFGSAKGLIEISDDFNDLLDDFSNYMP